MRFDADAIRTVNRMVITTMMMVGTMVGLLIAGMAFLFVAWLISGSSVFASPIQGLFTLFQIL